MASRWQSQVVVCEGGLDLSEDALTQGTNMPGSARVLQNYEPALEGGYRRISGYTKYSSTQVTGSASAIAGVKVALDRVYAAAGTRIYYSTGSTWTAIQDSTPADIVRSTTPTKTRAVEYSIGNEYVTFADGTDFAVRHDGTTAVLINGSGDSSGNPPSNPKFVEFFANSLCLAGHTADPTELLISAPNQDLNFSAVDGAISIRVGDIITGLKLFRNELYVFCQDSIVKIVPDTQTRVALDEVSKTLGCIASDTIQELGGDLIFLSQDGFRSIAATDQIGDTDLSLLSRKIQPLVRPVITSITSDNYCSVLIRTKSQYRSFYYDSNVTEANAGGFLGKLERGQGGVQYSWATTKGIQAFTADSNFIGTDEVAVFGHPTDGFVYQLESGNNFDGDNIAAEYESPQLTFGDASLRKSLHSVDIYNQVEGDINYNINVLFDFKSIGKIQPSPVNVNSSGSLSTFGSAVFGTDTFGLLELPVFRRSLNGSGFTAAFKFSSSENSKASHRLDSFQIEFGLKGRK